MRVFRIFLAVLGVLVLAGCTIRIGNGAESSAGPSGGGPGPVDVRSAATPKAGDCVTEHNSTPAPGNQPAKPASELWVVNCSNKDAVEKVTRLVAPGGSDACIADDYTGFDYTSRRPSLCLMLYGNVGDCYRGYTQRTPEGPRMSCTDPRAGIRLAAILPGHANCPTKAGDPLAARLFYGDVPGVGDRTYCLGSPRG